MARTWATCSIAAAAVLAFAWPRLAEVLIYQRTDILAGQAWRLWTGHLVHFTASHLFWDLLVFAAAGGWLEWIEPRIARWFYLLAPPAISFALFWGEPTLAYYGGLSGLATGVLILLALLQLRRGSREPRWFWFGVLALVVVKMAIELRAQTPLFARFESGVRNVPLAHVGGAVCALVAFRAVRRRSASRSG